MADIGSLHLHFGEYEIDVAAFELRRDGQPCAVEPQVLELLAYLVRNAGRLVTKGDLIEHVWGGRIVSDATLASRVKSARRAVCDDGEQQRLIRTVHSRGVRFVGEVTAELGNALEAAAEPGPETKGHAAKPAQPSIAVLPFANMSGDPEQSYLVDGLTGDIITDLARFRQLRVISHDSSFRYRESGADLGEIARTMEVSFQTIAAESARALEPGLPEAYAAKAMAHFAGGECEEADAAFELAVARGPASFDAHFFYGRHCLVEGRHEEAVRLFERAASLN